jgi:hypothetical protein
MNIAHVAPDSRSNSSPFIIENFKGLNGNLIHYHEGIPPKKKENSPINKLSFI